jgi:transposase InsO family protein
MNVGIPPRSRNHRLPAADDAPTASAASSLLKPSAIRCQNNRSTSRRNDGAPGDFNGALPVNSIIHPAGLPIATLQDQALQRPLESAQFTSWAFSQRVRDAGIAPSMGAVGSPYDNAMVESFWGRMQVELLNRRRWKTRIELATAIHDYIEHFHNTRRRHSALGMLTPAEAEARLALAQG